MTPLSSQEISAYSSKQLVSLAVEQSQIMTVQDKMIRKLERELQRLADELGSRNQRLLFSAESLDRMRQFAFGRSSERREGESPLFDKKPEDSAPAPESAGESKDEPKHRRGRRAQPDLAFQDVHHGYSKEDCDRYGLVEWVGQFEDSEEITVIPSRIVRQRHRRKKYFQKDPVTGAMRIITAPGPLKLKEGNRYSVDFAVEMGLAKYQWHLPLDRQRHMMAEQGLDISVSTIFDQVDTVAWYLRSTVFKAIRDKIEATPVNEADDTTWPNLENLKTRLRDKFYLWAVVNREAACYTIFDARNRSVAKNFLGNLKGTLVTDGHSSFAALASPHLILANDWYHVRRRFVAAEPNYGDDAKYFVDQIRKLSEIEAAIKNKPPDEVLAVRRQQSQPVVDAIRTKAESLGHILPECSLGRAIKYLRKFWTGLTVFLTDGCVPIGTNDVERALRGPAVGRKNHFGSKSMPTADVAAVWYSVIETCKLNRVNPREYITATIKAILSKQPIQMPWELASTPADLILS